MHKSDYLAQVEALRASPELRARVAGLAGTPARRRRLRPWMGVCACLAVLLLGGTLLLPRLGGSSAGGGGHAGGSIFQSYAGPVFPLTTLGGRRAHRPPHHHTGLRPLGRSPV